MSKEALLVIDMQKGYLNDKKKKDLESKLNIQKRIIGHFRMNQIPVVYVVVGRDLYQEKIPTIIKPLPSELVIDKYYSDAFERTNLYNELDANNLYIVGCNAEHCVRVTVESAVKLGYEVSIFKNAVLSQKSSRIAMAKMILKWHMNPNVNLINWQT